MTLGMAVDGKYQCFLCEYDFREESERDGRLRLLEHFRNVHDRTMVALQDRPAKAVAFVGPGIRGREWGD